MSGKSSCHLVSLDATKASNKLWRAGLFYKLINKIHAQFWRALFVYYAKSSIVVNCNGVRSKVFDTKEGVKKGGLMSPYLFNFFINDLICEIKALNVSALLGSLNVYIIAYCDDLILISSMSCHMKMILDVCSRYAKKWKLEFNPSKSVAYVAALKENRRTA